jgi:hypothetical protein
MAAQAHCSPRSRGGTPLQSGLHIPPGAQLWLGCCSTAGRSSSRGHCPGTRTAGHLVLGKLLLPRRAGCRPRAGRAAEVGSTPDGFRGGEATSFGCKAVKEVCMDLGRSISDHTFLQGACVVEGLVPGLQIQIYTVRILRSCCLGCHMTVVMSQHHFNAVLAMSALRLRLASWCVEGPSPVSDCKCNKQQPGTYSAPEEMVFERACSAAYCAQ